MVWKGTTTITTNAAATRGHRTNNHAMMRCYAATARWCDGKFKTFQNCNGKRMCSSSGSVSASNSHNTIAGTDGSSNATTTTTTNRNDHAPNGSTAADFIHMSPIPILPTTDMGTTNYDDVDMGSNYTRSSSNGNDHNDDEYSDDEYRSNNRLVWLQEHMQKQQQQQSTSPSLAEINQQTKDILSLPIGSFTCNTMEQCLRLMEYYTRHGTTAAASNTTTATATATVQENILHHNANQMTHILKRIIEENMSGNTSVYFHPAMAETVCLYWRQVSPLHCPAKTLEILQHVRDIVHDVDIPYNNIISILAKCRNRYAALAVEGILYKMIELELQLQGEEQEMEQNQRQQQYQHILHHKNHADIVTYNSAISSWMHIAKNEKDAGQRAVAILNRLGRGDNGKSVRPNVLSYSMAITALLRAEGSRAALQAEDLLQDYLYLHGCENGWIPSPSHDSSSSSGGEKDGIALQSHIQRMFDNVLEALCQRAEVDKEAAERAVGMLRYMESVGRQDLSREIGC
jgi:hypothetical protein